ncbi:unnamed protein product [Sphagnum jensenii]|uniref:Uncharacterized protein n=1 Tax=Sphagnum jensenii TaxID=128206 RepID=A0ABP0WLQ5_9BRYO
MATDNGHSISMAMAGIRVHAVRGFVAAFYPDVIFGRFRRRFVILGCGLNCKLWDRNVGVHASEALVFVTVPV